MIEQRFTKREYAGGASPQYDEPVEDFIFRLTQSAVKALNAGYIDLKMEVGECNGVSFEGTRPETDKEMAERIRKRDLAAETKVRAERAEYERLKGIYDV